MRLTLVSCCLLAGCDLGAAQADDDGGGFTSFAVQNGPFAINSVEPGHLIEVGIPIAQNQASANLHPIYNVRTTVGASDKLQLRAVVSLSRCNETDTPVGHGAGSGDKGSPCETMMHRVRAGTHYTYGYAPTFEARAIWKPNGKQIVGWTSLTCDTKTHHCPIVLDANNVTGAGDLGVPVGGAKTGNVVVEVRAYAQPGDGWMAGDIAELEGDCVGDDYGHCAGNEITFDEQDTHTRQDATQGQLTLVHETAAGPPHQDVTETALHAGQIQIFTGYFDKCNVAHPKPQVVLQRAVDVSKLAAGDVLQAETTFDAADDPGNGYNFDHYLGTWIILTSGPGDIYPTGAGSRWISPMTGENCTTDPCTKHMNGAVKLGADLPASGTMYINVLAEAIQQGSNTEGACAGPNPYTNDYVDVLPGHKHELHVTCYAATGAANCAW